MTVGILIGTLVVASIAIIVLVDGYRASHARVVAQLKEIEERKREASGLWEMIHKEREIYNAAAYKQRERIADLEARLKAIQGPEPLDLEQLDKTDAVEPFALMWSTFKWPAGGSISHTSDRLFATPRGQHGQGFIRALTIADTNVTDPYAELNNLLIYGIIVELIGGSPADHAWIRENAVLRLDAIQVIFDMAAFGALLWNQDGTRGTLRFTPALRRKDTWSIVIAFGEGDDHNYFDEAIGIRVSLVCDRAAILKERERRAEEWQASMRVVLGLDPKDSKADAEEA